MLLGNVQAGANVQLLNAPFHVVAEVLSVGSGSVTVECKGKRTQWSPSTHVKVVEKPSKISAQNASECPVDVPESKSRKTTHPDKPKAETPPKKAPKGKDIFGVTNGSQAAQANIVLLKLKKNVTIEMVVTENSSLIRSNVRSHFDRMAKDGLIDLKIKNDIRYYSVKKEKK